MPIESAANWADPTDDISEDSLENKAMWTHHKPEEFSEGEAKTYATETDPFIKLRKFQSKVGRENDILGQEKIRLLIGKHLVMGPDNILTFDRDVKSAGASLAFGANSQSNPMVRTMGDGRHLSDLEDTWGDKEKNIILETAQAILNYMLKFPPPVKTMGSLTEFCRIVPEWAVLKNGDSCTKTFVAGDYNRWGNAPSLYCCPAEGNDFKTLKEAIFETIGRQPTFLPIATDNPDALNIPHNWISSPGDMLIPHHLIMEMIHNYMAKLSIEPLFWGAPVRPLRLMDFSLSHLTGLNDYLCKMDDAKDVKRLLTECCSIGLVTTRSFNELIVNKMDSKPILDIFGWFLAKNFIKDKDFLTNDGTPAYDGIYFAGANAKRKLGDKESYKNHFVLFSEKNYSQSDLVRITQRLVLSHNKETDQWSVEVTDGKMPSSQLKKLRNEEHLNLQKLHQELKSSFQQMATSSEN